MDILGSSQGRQESVVFPQLPPSASCHRSLTAHAGSVFTPFISILSLFSPFPSWVVLNCCQPSCSLKILLHATEARSKRPAWDLLAASSLFSDRSLTLCRCWSDSFIVFLVVCCGSCNYRKLGGSVEGDQLNGGSGGLGAVTPSFCQLFKINSFI